MTGGTISSQLDPKTGGVKWLTSPEKLFEFYPKMFEHVNLKKPYLITGSVDVYPDPDDKFENGLKIDFNEFTEIYNHDSLIKGGIFDKNDPGLVKTGLPSTLGQGNLTLHTSDSSVLRFLRGGSLNLFAWDDILAISNLTGRVRLVEIFSSGNDDLVSLVNQFEQEQQNKITLLKQETQRKIKQVQSIHF